MAHEPIQSEGEVHATVRDILHSMESSSAYLFAWSILTAVQRGALGPATFDLSHRHCGLVDAFVSYLWHDTYCLTNPPRLCFVEGPANGQRYTIDTSKPVWHLAVIAMAEDLGCSGLYETAIEKLRDSLKVDIGVDCFIDLVEHAFNKGVVKDQRG
ncbi:uncharacterized protein EI97DRAFT_438438 [Westerdykella ornata]|uniref:Uncharacterized protein n=1 Tax=Westerdykella ornata TaxID=318751 RepID=A0A6A6JWP3_WESOR|nr:uncharacterized protein EI97DRAFT_438438 [Westerdykella ornata]KAF2281031.1 hypothetical protein EI97DRAFT_438438 [Westerdykella ornata]